MRIVLYVLVAVCLVLFSCDPDGVQPCTDPSNPDCPGYNPCLVAKSADAYFGVNISIPGFNCNDERGSVHYYGNIDSIWNDRTLTFTAWKTIKQNYYWRIGADPNIYTDKEIQLYFDPSFVGSIQVELITTVEDSNHCLALYERSDTSTKVITFIPVESGRTYLNGKFRGIDLDAPLDTFTMEIPTNVWNIGLKNFPKDCSDTIIPIPLNSRSMLIPPNTIVCGAPCGSGILEVNQNTIQIEYSVENGIGGRTLRKFVGTRVQ